MVKSVVNYLSWWKEVNATIFYTATLYPNLFQILDYLYRKLCSDYQTLILTIPQPNPENLKDHSFWKRTGNVCKKCLKFSSFSVLLAITENPDKPGHK